jgi:transcriptional regulator with XRE-family HTH domain
MRPDSKKIRQARTADISQLNRLIIRAAEDQALARSGPKLTRIATTLGVSAATVSNALSGKGRVSAELAEKIRSVAAEIGYVPSQAGRALRTGKSAVIGLVFA